MADRPGSFRTHHNVSRHTMVMRKAKEDDAKRLAESERSLQEDPTVTTIIRAPKPVSVKLPGDGAKAGSAKSGTTAGGKRTLSGRTVVIQREGEISKRLTVSSRREGTPTSVRVTGGDTIIRYQSGDMVIKRGSRQAELRKQILWAYAIGYILLFGSFAYFLITGTSSLTPDAYVEKAFARRHGDKVVDLEWAAMEAMRGNRTPAEVRFAENFSFYDENKDRIQIENGDRLTLLAAAKLGRAVIEDQKLDPARRTFAKPFKLYKETYLANMNWPFWLTLYNSFGFFLLLILFLWRPIRNYLGTQGKKVAVDIRNARNAQDEALELRNRYRDLAADLEKRRATLREQVEASTLEERETALHAARTQADTVAGSVDGTIALERKKMMQELSADAAREACVMAREILEKRLGRKEHDTAIDELIADITAMRLTGNS